MSLRESNLQRRYKKCEFENYNLTYEKNTKRISFNNKLLHLIKEIGKSIEKGKPSLSLIY